MGKRPKLTVSYTLQARTELDAIWVWNARKYNAQHATDYILFLEKHIGALERDYGKGKAIEPFSTLRQITLKPSHRGDGHVAIYEINEDAWTVVVLHIYHTKQDIEGRLEQERD